MTSLSTVTINVRISRIKSTIFHMTQHIHRALLGHPVRLPTGSNKSPDRPHINQRPFIRQRGQHYLSITDYAADKWARDPGRPLRLQYVTPLFFFGFFST